MKKIQIAAAGALLGFCSVLIGCSAPVGGSATAGVPSAVSSGDMTTATSISAPTTTAVEVSDSAAATTPADDSTPVSSEPSNSTSFLVSGSASSASDGSPLQGVKIGFELESCAPKCALRTTVTNSSGDYSVELPAGIYVTVCAAAGAACAPDASQANDHEVDLHGNRTVNYLVTRQQEPATSPSSSEPGGTETAAGQHSLSGEVMDTNGRPVSGVAIELDAVTYNYHMTTGPDGAYSFDLNGGIYNAMCVVPNENYECGPRNGDGGQTPVDGSESGRKLNFIVCRTEDYPACLTR